jgi:23S rRNA (cytidine1920-2'-O)/16S rRNA (cytidine1409-2'-O)-methyltransferase
MLQHGATRVIAVDTGYGQIAQKLRDDSRVELLERTNARYLEPGSLSPEISFMAMDVSFISATLVLPAVVGAIGGGREMVILVKPQFESGREAVGKGGIVRDAVAQAGAVERVRLCVLELGAKTTEVIDSPVLGAEGNKEFLLHALF